MAAAKRWGFHQLDSRWAARLVDDAGVRRGDLVVDVGAGYGAITQPLVARGARVIAVELHRSRASELRARFVGTPVSVVVADAADLRLPARPFRVVANPPFGATTGLLRRLTANGSRLVRADVVVPAHVARRWASDRAPGIGRWGGEFSVWVDGAIPRAAFSPPATVGVARLVIERRGVRSPTDRAAAPGARTARPSTTRSRRAPSGARRRARGTRRS